MGSQKKNACLLPNKCMKKKEKHLGKMRGKRRESSEKSRKRFKIESLKEKLKGKYVKQKKTGMKSNI